MGTDGTVASAMNAESGSGGGTGAEGEPGSAGEPRSHEPRQAIISDELSSAVKRAFKVALNYRCRGRTFIYSSHFKVHVYPVLYPPSTPCGRASVS